MYVYKFRLKNIMDQTSEILLVIIAVASLAPQGVLKTLKINMYVRTQLPYYHSP